MGCDSFHEPGLAGAGWARHYDGGRLFRYGIEDGPLGVVGSSLQLGRHGSNSTAAVLLAGGGGDAELYEQLD